MKTEITLKIEAEFGSDFQRETFLKWFKHHNRYSVEFYNTTHKDNKIEITKLRIRDSLDK